MLCSVQDCAERTERDQHFPMHIRGSDGYWYCPTRGKMAIMMAHSTYQIQKPSHPGLLHRWSGHSYHFACLLRPHTFNLKACAVEHDRAPCIAPYSRYSKFTACIFGSPSQVSGIWGNEGANGHSLGLFNSSATLFQRRKQVSDINAAPAVKYLLHQLACPRFQVPTVCSNQNRLQNTSRCHNR